MRAQPQFAVWYKIVDVVGGAGRRRPKRQTGRITPYGAVERRELCVHDGALRVGVFDASESYGHARHARRVGYIDITVGGSKRFRRPTSNFGGI